MTGNRLERVNNELKRELSIIINNKLRDPQITNMITVLECEVTPDLSECRVYLSTFGDMDSEEVLSRIKGAGGFIRKELAHSIKLRITPRLEFILDKSANYGEKIDSILNNIKYSKEEDLADKYKDKSKKALKTQKANNGEDN